jgi:hypothetical protein
METTRRKTGPDTEQLQERSSESPALTPVRARIIAASSEIREQPDAVEKAYMARQLVQCTLPHSDPGNVPLWSRRNGNAILTIQQGSKRGELLGYPSGTLPRLLLFWLVTEAVRGKKRRIHLGNHLAAFMRDLGLDPSRGGPRSDVARLKDQAERLFRARISFERATLDETAEVIEEQWVDMPIGAETQIFFWEEAPGNPVNPFQMSLLENWVELGEKFFEAITAYPVPADMRALRALKNSALALDLYVWATYRVYLANRKGCAPFIPWGSFMRQMGCNYASVKDFKRHALAAFKNVREVYPTLNISQRRGGFFIHPGTTAVPAASPKLPGTPSQAKTSAMPIVSSKMDKQCEDGSQPACEDYVRKVLEAYIDVPVTTGKASSADYRTAENLFQKNIPLETIEDAIALGCARHLFRDPDDPPLEKPRSLAYFLPIIDEVAAQKANKEVRVRNEYWVYVRAKVAWLLADTGPGRWSSRPRLIDFCLDIAMACRKQEGSSEDAPTL